MKTSIGLCSRCAVLLNRSQRTTQANPARRRWISSLEIPPRTLATAQRKAQNGVSQTTKRSSTSSTSPTQASPDDEPYISSLGQPSLDRQRVLLQPNNLFHPFSSSPSPEIRRRAAFMKQHAYCPHPSHQRTRLATSPNDPENRKPMPGETTTTVSSPAQPPAHVRFECPDCGIPVFCCEAHWMDDYESHLDICETLRQVNEDDHDLRSGRFFPEFEYPGHQRAEEFVVNMSNWDTFLYTRDFAAMNDPRSMRQATRLLTYPITVGSVLHELSPYSIRRGERLTNEGLRSLAGSLRVPSDTIHGKH